MKAGSGGPKVHQTGVHGPAPTQAQAGRGLEVETFSEGHSNRTVLVLRDVEGGAATLIVLRQAGRVHVVFHGALRTTVVMTDAQVAELIEAMRAASRGPTHGSRQG